jgi:tryptophan 2,3-dioxygenase
MTCPYAQSMMNVINNNNNDIVDKNKQSTSTTMVNGDDADLLVKNKKKKEKDEEPLNYTTYLRTETLLSALRCLSHINPSDENSEPVHDEHFFILLHQGKLRVKFSNSNHFTYMYICIFSLVYELWFKAALFEIDSIRKIFSDSDDSNNIMKSLFNINSRLSRCVKIWKILIEQLELLETMTPVEFLEFRNYITPASGFQSLQFRMIEMKLGLTDKSRHSFKKEYFTHTMFKNEQAAQLEKTINESSLLVLVEVNYRFQKSFSVNYHVHNVHIHIELA